MGYHLRYLLTDPEPTTLDLLERALREVDGAYTIRRTGADEHGELLRGDELFGEIEIDRPGELFDEELVELREAIAGAEEEPRRIVEHALATATAMVVVRVLWQGREPEPTLDAIDPLWEWLFEHRTGLLHADGEGWYDDGELLLQTE